MSTKNKSCRSSAPNTANSRNKSHTRQQTHPSTSTDSKRQVAARSNLGSSNENTKESQKKTMPLNSGAGISNRIASKSNTQSAHPTSPISAGTVVKSTDKLAKSIVRQTSSGSTILVEDKNLNELSETQQTTFGLKTMDRSNNKTHDTDTERVEQQETDVDSRDELTTCSEEDSEENTHLLTFSKSSRMDEYNDTNSNGSETTLQDLSQTNDETDPSNILQTTKSKTTTLEPSAAQHKNNTVKYNKTIIEMKPAAQEDCILFYDDEEINIAQKTSSDDDDLYESNGAALTLDDTSESTFVVYPLGSCEFDETQLVSATSTKAIQKCILRLSNKPSPEETYCWGLDQTQPILMKLFDDHIQFTDINTGTLLRSQPIQTIKTWAVDDDNNFAFVIEDTQAVAGGQVSQQLYELDDMTRIPGAAGAIGSTNSSTKMNCEAEFALLSEPVFRCYVFSSMDDDDDMSCKVAAKLNEEINKHREQMSDRILMSTRIQQMIEQPVAGGGTVDNNSLNVDGSEDQLDELEATSESTMNVKYIGHTNVPKPVGIDVLNVAIDKCLAEASKKVQVGRPRMVLDDDDDDDVDEFGNAYGGDDDDSTIQDLSPLIEAKLHVSPSSVIVENEMTGEIIVECRIRYLTFMGISRRDIRWCGFIMQNPTNKTFVAHCFECHPTAGHVCEAIQLSCTRMYQKVVKNSRQPETVSIIPSRSKIRTTLAKTFSRIRLNPILNN